MADVTNFNVLGESIKVKDSVAREYNWLYGKKIVVYGDSTASTLNNYWTTLAELFPNSFELTNRAVGGTLLTNRGANNGVTLIRQAGDLSNFDYMFVCYGTNEWQNGHSDIYGTTTNFVDYCVREIVRKVESLTNPPKLVFITPFFSYREWGTNININPTGNMLFNYNYAICREAQRLGCEYIDFYTTSGCNIHNYKSKLSDDSGGIFVHENKEFSKELAMLVWNRVTCTDIESYPDNGDNMLNYNDLLNTKTTVDDLENVMTGYACPPYVTLNTSEIMLSGKKTFTPGYYRFIGYSSGNAEIGINNKVSVDLTQRGLFDFVIRIDNSFVEQFKFMGVAKTTFSGVRIFKVGRDPNMYFNTYNSACPPSSTHTIGKGSGCMYEKGNCLVIEPFTLTATSVISSGTSMVAWNNFANKNYKGTIFLTMYNATTNQLFSAYVLNYQLHTNAQINSGDVVAFPGLNVDFYPYVSI